LPTGFIELDDLMSGLQKGDFIVVAGRPSMGKTALGLNIAEHMAANDHRPVAFFSMEMSKEQVVQRLICGRARVDSHRFRKRMLSQEDAQKLEAMCEDLATVPLFVDDTPGMTVLELRAKARRLKQQFDIAAVFVDYLQLMYTPNAESRQQEISVISRGLKSLGRELGIPVVTMAQLNRQAEGREGHRPRMSDLRESGAIEQDADVILLIHREEYYKKDDASVKNQAEIIVAKQRNGPTATVKLVFNHQLTRFDNWSPVPDPGYVTTYVDDAPF
jgi:replicative DNA helicase